MKQHLTLPQLPKQDQSGNINQQELIHFLSAIQRILSDKQREDYGENTKIYSEIPSMEQIEQHIIDLLYPIGSRYIQLSEPDGTWNSAEAPGTKFGGLWVLRFATEGTFFKTEGHEPTQYYKDNVLTAYRGSNGLAEDKMQMTSGNLRKRSDLGMVWSTAGISEVNGVFRVDGISRPVVTGSISAGQGVIFNSRLSPNSKTTLNESGRTEPVNRLMRIYERIE